MDKASWLMILADKKAKVKGKYFGVYFTGTVISSRQITTRPFPEQATIELDEPITVFGAERQRVLMNSADLENCPSYNFPMELEEVYETVETTTN